MLYQHGFDILIAGMPIFFSPHILKINPYGIMIPEKFLSYSKLGLIVEGCNSSLKLKHLEAYKSKELEVLKLPLTANWKVIKKNIIKLKKYLHLFGVDSIIKGLIFNNSDFPNPLYEHKVYITQNYRNFALLKKFIGWGSGLTPSFDDFLSGILFTDKLFGLDFIEFPENLICSILKQTTIQSVQQLKTTALGKMSFLFEDFMEKINNKPLGAEEIMKILDYGHSSGTDILCGIYFHLKNVC